MPEEVAPVLVLDESRAAGYDLGREQDQERGKQWAGQEQESPRLALWGERHAVD